MASNSDRDAILRGMKAAAKFHRDLATRERNDGSVRIDVYGAIARTGAVLMFQTLDPLLGAFMREEGTEGIIVTIRRPVGQQRFTASHELGHLMMRHDPHADDDRILRRAPVEGRYQGVPVQEREADAFASHFLLPKFALAQLMRQQQWSTHDFEDPQTLYQASLRLGASYDATVRAFEREKTISLARRRDLLRTKPRDLKADLVNGHPVNGWANRDVWRLTEHDEGVVIEARREDLFLLKLREHRGSGYLWTFDELKRAGFVIVRDEAEPLTPGRIGGIKRRVVLGEASMLQEGSYLLEERRGWGDARPAQTLSLSFRSCPGREAGLFEQQLERLLSAR